MRLRKVEIHAARARLTRPFTMMDLAYVGDMAVSIYLCHGVLAWHKHIDHDELFLVHEGIIRLESEWGSVTLRPDEMAVVPKGVVHRSSSALPSLVLLISPRFAVDRKNGQRRLVALDGELHKVSLPRVRSQRDPLGWTDVGTIEDFTVAVAAGQGRLAPQPTSSQTLLIALRGRAGLQVDREWLELGTGELIVIPRDTWLGLTVWEEALVLRVAR